MSTPQTRFVVMTSSAHVSQRLRRYGGAWRNVAVVEVEGDDMPSMISERARGVVRVVTHYGARRVGKTERGDYQRAMAEAQDLAARLNADPAELERLKALNAPSEPVG